MEPSAVSYLSSTLNNVVISLIVKKIIYLWETNNRNIAEMSKCVKMTNFLSGTFQLKLIFTEVLKLIAPLFFVFGLFPLFFFLAFWSFPFFAGKNKKEEKRQKKKTGGGELT